MIALAAILVTAVAAAPARATVLGPGGTVTAPNPTFGPIAYSGGTVLVSVANEAPVVFSGIDGTLTTEVIRESGGTLDFLYQIVAASSNTTNIQRVTATSFGGFSTDVQWGTAGTPFSTPTMAGTVASADRSLDGTTVGWSFTSAGVAAGQESYVLIIKTNATSYTTGSTFAIDGGIMSFNSYAPSGTVASVPEPSTLAVAGIGALGLIGYGLRRRKALGA